MFSKRQFFPSSSNDHLFNYSQVGNTAFDWDDLANNSSHELLYMCRRNGINVEAPYLKRTMILLLRDFIESREVRATIPLAPVKAHVNQLKSEYISAAAKASERIRDTSRSSTSSISSETTSTSSTTTSTSPYLSEEVKRPEKKESLSQTVKLAFEKPRKFIANILAIPVDSQRKLFRYLFIFMHIILFILYLTNNNFKLQKGPRILPRS